MEATYLNETVVQSKVRGSGSQGIISPHLSVAEKIVQRKTNIANSLSTIEDKLLAYVFLKSDLRLVNMFKINQWIL